MSKPPLDVGGAKGLSNSGKVFYLWKAKTICETKLGMMLGKREIWLALKNEAAMFSTGAFYKMEVNP